MSGPTPATANVNDFGQFAKLRSGARARSADATREAARQFESLFTQMLLKASHSGDSGDDLLGGSQSDVYRDMFDQQMALHLSSGKGLGLAEMLYKQLQGPQAATGKTGTAATQGLLLDAPKPAAYPLDSTGKALSIDVTGDSKAFVDSIQPYAEKAAQELGVPAKVLVAQAALETGWGKHPIKNADGSASNNFFGIKADAGWAGGKTSTATQEFSGGVAHTQSAQFRSYGSIAEGFDDYVKFVKSNPRYADALRRDPDVHGDAGHYIQGLQKAGYATDPAYAQKIARIAYGSTLQTALASSANPATRIA